MAKYTDSNGLRYVLQKIKTLLTGYAKSSDIPTDYVSDVAYSSSTRKITKTKAGSASDVVTLSKVATSNSYADLDSKPTIPSAGTGTDYPKMDGSRSLGSQAGYARVDHVHPTDTSRLAASQFTNANVYSMVSAYAETQGTTIVDQNAFGKVKVGSTTIDSDALRDTLELAAGSNVTLTPDATNDKVTIAATNTTYNVATTNFSGLMMAETEFEDAPAGTYLAGILVNTESEMYVGEYVLDADDIPELPASKITSGTFDAARIPNLAASKITSGTFAAARIPSATTSAKGGVIIDSSITSGSTSTNVPTTAAVASFVASQVAGALEYKGAVSAESSLLNTALKKGWYYIVSMPNDTTTSITIGGVQCEAGDMVFVRTAGTYTTSTALGAAIDVVQANIDTLTNGEIDTIWNEVFA